jgi:DNA primase
MRRYGIKYSIEENKVIIPHYDVNGYLIGIRGRTLNPDEAAAEGKYRPIVFNERVLSHPLGYNLYGLNFIKGNIKRIGMAIVGEGEKAAL